MLDFTHRDYFQHFRLNVEQYGEILVAQAFRGIKMGDEQVGYDVKVTKSDFIDVFRAAGIDIGQRLFCLPDEEIRIEVKSKWSHTREKPTAEVIGLKETKLAGLEKGGRRHLAMTHLAVVLVYPGSRRNRAAQEEGLIANAWLLTLDRAVAMRNNTARKYKSLSVREIKAAISCDCDIIDIKPLLESIANMPLLGILERAKASLPSTK